MTSHPQNVCPHCGKPIPDEKTKAPTAAAAETSAIDKGETREYDHRGIPLPMRTRMGGIITPQ